MTPAPKTEIEDLRREVEYHNWRYYVLDDPEISDAGGPRQAPLYRVEFVPPKPQHRT